MKSVGMMILLGMIATSQHSRADVAQIGAQTYPSLPAAVAAAQSNDTITLIDDAVLTQVLSIAVPLSIVSDGTVRTITRTNAFTDDLILIQAPGAITLGDDDGSDASPTLILDGGFTNGVAGGFSFLFAADADVVIHPGVVLRHFHGYYAPLYMQNNTSDATLTLYGGLFAHNMATNSSGGAIASQGANLYIRDAVFASNAAPHGRGGAIYLENAILAATNLTATGNQADDYGGGLMIFPGAAILNGGAFTGNSAINGGGIANGYGDLEIHGTLFTNNLANFGAALWSHSGNNLVNSADIRHNHAVDYGGAINAISSGFTLTNSHLIANTAGSNGGGVYVAPDSPHSILSIHASTVSSNTGLNGGAIYSSHAHVELAGSMVAGNRAAGPGGGLWLFGDTTIRDCWFTDNVSSNEGGGIFHLGGPLRVGGQTRVEGNAGTQGNGIWCYNGLYAGSNAVLTLDGGVTIAADNEVALYTNEHAILLGGTLTAPGPVATLTPPAYLNGTTLLADAPGLSFPAVSRYYAKFDVTPQPASPTNWYVGTNGNLTFTAPPSAPVPPVELRDIHSLAANPAAPGKFQLAVDPLLLEYDFTLQAADTVEDGGWNFQTLLNGYTIADDGVLSIDSDAPLRIYRLAF